MRTKLILGVSGGSGSGKHRVIHHHLLPALGDALILEHDWYYHELPYLLDRQRAASRLDVNYDTPEAYENSLLVQHLEALKADRRIHVHAYQKSSGYRNHDAMSLEPHDVVIVDGMMVLAVPELVALMDIRIYVDAPDELRLSRRVARDLSFCSAEESEIRFHRDVLPAHRTYVEPSRGLADYVLLNSRNGEAPEGLDALLDAIRRTRAAMKPADSVATGGPHP